MNRLNRRCLLSAFASLALPATGWAHPGHADGTLHSEGSGWVHYLSVPEHAIPILGAIVLVTLSSLLAGKFFAARVWTRCTDHRVD